jgi:hypothetical protein
MHSLGWGPTEWARHAAAATYTATGQPGAAEGTAEGTGAVVQMPLHWRLLAGRLGQQSRASGSGDIPVAPSGSSCNMFDGRHGAASGRHRGHYTAILPEQQCHLDRRGGNYSSHRGPETRLSRPLSRMTRSRAVQIHRHRGKRWCVRYSDQIIRVMAYGDVPGLHMSIDFACLSGGRGGGISR